VSLTSAMTSKGDGTESEKMRTTFALVAHDDAGTVPHTKKTSSNSKGRRGYNAGVHIWVAAAGVKRGDVDFCSGANGGGNLKREVTSRFST
jgi:hypothetical protein